MAENKEVLDSTGLSYLWAQLKTKLGGTRSVRKTVGTSTNGWTKKDCDYLCDGTADETEIMAAINSLKSTGGEVVLLDGTYNIASKISISKSYVTLRGNGKGTKLVRGFGKAAILEITEAGSNCTITGLYIDGKKANYTTSENDSIVVAGHKNTIIGNELVGSSHYSIKVGGDDNTITGNILSDNDIGIFMQSGERNIVTENIVSGNYIGIANYGSNYSCIANNVCNLNEAFGIEYNGGDNGSITGNTCTGGEKGIYLSFGSNIAITGNSCCGNTAEGIFLYDGDNTVTGNTCCNNDIGIYGYYSERNNICGNLCTQNKTCNIKLTGTEYGLISGNNLAVMSGDDTIPANAILLEGSSNANNIVANNHVGTGAITSEGGSNNVMGSHIPVTVNLSASGWSGQKQTVNVSGVTAENTVIITPAPASLNAYAEAGVYCSAQADGTLTFTCDSVPSEAITVNVAVFM